MSSQEAAPAWHAVALNRRSLSDLEAEACNKVPERGCRARCAMQWVCCADSAPCRGLHVCVMFSMLCRKYHRAAMPHRECHAEGAMKAMPCGGCHVDDAMRRVPNEPCNVDDAVQRGHAGIAMRRMPIEGCHGKGAERSCG
eukprot:115692-Chlamydomonas_euryale.AAC.4